MLQTGNFIRRHCHRTFGNIGRDAYYGPGFGALDFSVFRNFQIPPDNRLGAQFRVEIFNLH